MADYTRIPVYSDTRDRIRELKRRGETYDHLLNRMADEISADGEGPRPRRV